jgi:hypothetical protein
VGVATLLIEEKADIEHGRHVGNDRPLTVACYRKNVTLVKMLIEAGAELDHVGFTEAMTALQHAASVDAWECIELLLEAGCHVDKPVNDEGATTLMQVLETDGRFTDTILTLLEGKADVNWEGYFGYTVLANALEGSASRSTLLLLRCLGSVDAGKKGDDNDSVEEYECFLKWLEEQHASLLRVLGSEVEVDTRVGRRETGMYHEPLESTMEYLGFSLKKDKATNRVLLPGVDVLKVYHWCEKFVCE